MKILILEGLPYVTATLTHRGKHLLIEKVILDTGSAGTLFSADKLSTMGLLLEPHDSIHRMRGIGGTEFVFSKQVDHLALGDLKVDGFEIEVGAMDYGFDIEGIVGVNFPLQAKAIIDLDRLEVYQATGKG